MMERERERETRDKRGVAWPQSMHTNVLVARSSGVVVYVDNVVNHLAVPPTMDKNKPNQSNLTNRDAAKKIALVCLGVVVLVLCEVLLERRLLLLHGRQHLVVHVGEQLFVGGLRLLLRFQHCLQHSLAL